MRRAASFLFIALSLISCSEPPRKERQQAEDALAAARAADAVVYAAVELKAAETALARYEGAVAQRDYRQALNYALDARDRAYQAAQQAATAKARARTEITALIAEVEAAIKTGTDRLTPAHQPKLSATAVQRLRTAVRAAHFALQEARTLVAKDNYREALRRLSVPAQVLRKELGAAGTQPATPSRR